MNLSADSGGFLVGSAPVDLSGEQDKLQILRAIKADTAAMRTALTNSARASGGKAQAAATAASVTQAVRTAMRQRPAANGDMERMVVPERVQQRRERKAITDEVAKAAKQAVTPNRAKNGRFLSRAEREAGGEGVDSVGRSGGVRAGIGRLLGKVGSLAASLRDGVSNMMSGTEQVDPALTAAKEVGDMMAPLQAPLKGMAGLFRPREERIEREKTEKKITVPWYRRLWHELRALNKKPTGASSVSVGGLGGMLMKLPGVGMLLGLLARFGGVLRPLLGVFGKLALPLTALYSAFTSFFTSTEEYAERLGVVLDGSLLQELGVRFVGVLGDLGNTLTFGLAGKFGEYIAPAVSQMIEGVVSAWDDTAKWCQNKWGEMTGKFDAVIESIRKWFADKIGVPLEKAKEVGATVTEKVGKATNAASDWIDKQKTALVEKAKAVGAVVTAAQDTAGEWVGKKTDAVAGAFGGGSKGRRQAMQAAMLSAGITDPREQAMIMAQMDHESAGFTASEESFKYRSADRLMAVSGTARRKGASAVEAAMAQGPEAVAELMYGGRMGNSEKGDGYKFRGRGAIQLTGKDNYAAAGKDLGIDLLNNPELAADPAIAAQIAMWYWKKNNLGDAARKGDVTGVTRRINGGTNGLADRKTKFKEYLAAANAGSLAVDSRVMAAGVTGAATVQPGASVPSMASAAPPAGSQTVPPAPSVPRKVASNESKAPPPPVFELPLTQNLADRGLAQAATGGIGMNLAGG